MCLPGAEATTETVYIGQNDVLRSSARQAGRRTVVVAREHDLDDDSVLEIVGWAGRQSGSSPRCPEASASEP